MKAKNTSFLFTHGNLNIQIYQMMGDTTKYMDRLGNTVSVQNTPVSPLSPKRWAPCGFCGGGGYEEPYCFKKRNQTMVQITNNDATNCGCNIGGSETCIQHNKANDHRWTKTAETKRSGRPELLRSSTTGRKSPRRRQRFDQHGHLGNER